MTAREVIDEVMKIAEEESHGGVNINYDLIMGRLTRFRKQLPKGTGKWLDKKITIKKAHGIAYGRWGCSVCKVKQPHKSNFCPNCGADMRGDRMTNKEAIRALESIQPSQRWIPCSEKLPVAEYGESDNVLATCELRNADDTSYRWVKTLYFNGGVWCYPTGETYEQKVIAWMPLPEPYKGG